MIPVTRISEPPVLAKNAARWLEALELIQSNNKATKAQINQAQNKYGHREVKEALVKMFNGKCAYCESKINYTYLTTSCLLPFAFCLLPIFPRKFILHDYLYVSSCCLFCRY